MPLPSPPASCHHVLASDPDFPPPFSWPVATAHRFGSQCDHLGCSTCYGMIMNAQHKRKKKKSHTRRSVKLVGLCLCVSKDAEPELSCRSLKGQRGISLHDACPALVGSRRTFLACFVLLSISSLYSYTLRLVSVLASKEEEESMVDIAAKALETRSAGLNAQFPDRSHAKLLFLSLTQRALLQHRLTLF